MLNKSKNIVLLQARDSAEAAEREIVAVRRTIGVSPERLQAMNVMRGDDLSSALSDTAVIIIGGSEHSVFEDLPEIGALTETAVAAREKGLPMFGICFGIQLIAQAFGGRVVRDRDNIERGTFDIQLTQLGLTDSLFRFLPERFPAQCSHQDKIVSLPEDARLLAFSERCPVQAFVMPGNIYGVQFHPERTKSELEQVFLKRSSEMSTVTGQLSPGGVPLRESPDAPLILRRFIETL
jgi:GMP synthase (glutamine-hydrolysing)